MPLQIQPNAGLATTLHKPVAVKAFVDTAKILGLPKFPLRDSHGSLYLPNKVLLQEPFALLQDRAGQSLPVETKPRRAYIVCLLYTSPSPRDRTRSRMPSSA